MRRRARRYTRSSPRPILQTLFSFALPGAAHPGPLSAELQSDAYRLLRPCIVGQGIEGTRVRPDEPRDGHAPQVLGTSTPRLTESVLRPLVPRVHSTLTASPPKGLEKIRRTTSNCDIFGARFAYGPQV